MLIKVSVVLQLNLVAMQEMHIDKVHKNYTLKKKALYTLITRLTYFILLTSNISSVPQAAIVLSSFGYNMVRANCDHLSRSKLLDSDPNRCDSPSYLQKGESRNSAALSTCK